MEDVDCTAENTINITDDATALLFVYSPMMKISLSIILLIVLFAGLLGHGLFFLTVYRIQRMRTVTNTYLCSISIADLIFIFYFVSSFVYTVFTDTVKRGAPVATSHGCILLIFLGVFPYYVSLILITLVTLERFYAICLPLSQWTLSSKSRTRQVILVSWVVALSLTAAMIPHAGKIHFECIIWPNEEQYEGLPDKRWNCDVISNSVSLRIYCIVYVAASYLILLIVNFVMYAAIIRALSNRSVVTSLGEQRKSEVTEIRNQVARLLIIFGIVFFVCQTPRRLSAISDHLNQLGSQRILPDQGFFDFILTIFLVPLNSVINPYVYVIFSKSYRDAFLEALNLKKESQLVKETNSVSLKNSTV
ncbi:orexin receptor type 2-like [Amphiura filiformis]|uniref:orexin receptor type 2-like n=1 Tax=Amphiura filiformis TaxID=82378 RepID=UPI003B22098A